MFRVYDLKFRMWFMTWNFGCGLLLIKKNYVNVFF